MQPQREEETDEEYLDDPIKLFDFEQERVHFGSHSQEYGTSAFRQSTSNNVQNDTEATASPQCQYRDFSESDCLPLYIKLVDCGKFPWYFRKYTQQILTQTTVCHIVCDSDSEVDVEQTDDHDCIILDKVTNELNSRETYNSEDASKILRGVIPKTAVERKLEVMKCRDDYELKRALSLKNMNEVDFKRNKGLIGMTITQKVESKVSYDTVIHQTNKTEDASIRQIIFPENNSYVSVANKILSNVGTELIPITEGKEVITKIFEISPIKENQRNKEIRTEKYFENVRFNLGEISEKLINHIVKPKKSCNKPRKLKDGCNKISSRKAGSCSNASLKTTNSMNNVSDPLKTLKNVKKVKNKNYKNSLVKSIEFMSSKSRDVVKDTKKCLNYNQNTKSYKTDEGSLEPLSPILPCNTLSKKYRHLSAILFQEDMRKTLTKKSYDITQVVNKPVATDDVIHSASKINTHKQVAKKNTANLNESYAVIKKNLDDLINYNQLPAKSYNNCNETLEAPVSFNHIQSCTSTYIIDKNLARHENTFAPNNNSNSLPKIVSVKSLSTTPCTSIHINQPNTETTMSSPGVISFHDTQGTRTNDFNKTEFRNAIENVHVHNHNFCAPVNLKPSQHNTSENKTKFNQLEYDAHKPLDMSLKFKPKFYQNPYTTNYHIPQRHERDDKISPMSTNCSFPTYSLPPPHINEHQAHYNLVQPVHLSKGWQQQKKNLRGIRKIFPSQLPIKVSQAPSGSLNSELHVNSQLKRVNQPQNVLQPNKLSQLANVQHLTTQPNSRPEDDNINDGFLKKIYDDVKSSLGNTNDVIPESNDTNRNSEANHETVTCKIKMLEVLDNAINNLKKENENNARDAATVIVNAFKTPKFSEKEETASNNDHYKQMKLQKGYSPPILPIPTYEKAMGGVISDLRTHDKQKNNTVIKKNVSDDFPINQFDKYGKRKLDQESSGRERKEDTRKISLEEYKRRIFKADNKLEDFNKNCRNKQDGGRKQMQAQIRPNVNRCSTESDLGYDSDHTVVL